VVLRVLLLVRQVLIVDCALVFADLRESFFARDAIRSATRLVCSPVRLICSALHENYLAGRLSCWPFREKCSPARHKCCALRQICSTLHENYSAFRENYSTGRFEDASSARVVQRRMRRAASCMAGDVECGMWGTGCRGLPMRRALPRPGGTAAAAAGCPARRALHRPPRWALADPAGRGRRVSARRAFACRRAAASLARGAPGCPTAAPDSPAECQAARRLLQARPASRALRPPGSDVHQVCTTHPRSSCDDGLPCSVPGPSWCEDHAASSEPGRSGSAHRPGSSEPGAQGSNPSPRSSECGPRTTFREPPGSDPCVR
jgi:hypothetical protein